MENRTYFLSTLLEKFTYVLLLLSESVTRNLFFFLSSRNSDSNSRAWISLLIVAKMLLKEEGTFQELVSLSIWLFNNRKFLGYEGEHSLEETRSIYVTVTTFPGGPITHEPPSWFSSVQ